MTMDKNECITWFKILRANMNTFPEISANKKIEALSMAIKALETLEEFEKAQIITGGRLNGRTYAYKCGLEDGKRKALEQEPKILALLEKTYDDFCKCEGGEGYLKIDGKEYPTDAGYALEGMSIFMEVFKQRLAKSEDKE